MGFAHVVIGADYAALEDGEEVLDCVGVVVRIGAVHILPIVHCHRNSVTVIRSP
jgi:hypothetical protein